MEQFRRLVTNIYEEGSAEKMIAFLELCWHDRVRKAQGPLPHRDVTDRPASQRDHGDVRLEQDDQSRSGQSGGPSEGALWDPLVLWVCPSGYLLDAIASKVRAAGLRSLTSLGSGTGLLEWLLRQRSGLEVTSLEVNRSWWESCYAPPTFVQHVYTDEISDPGAQEHGETGIYEVPPTDAFMTCYFNNDDVFNKYVTRYQGPLLLIIGSEEGSVATRPAPLDYTQHEHWRLDCTVSLGPSPGHDLLAVYVRRTESLKVAHRLKSSE